MMTQPLTQNERGALLAIQGKLHRLREVLNASALPDVSDSPALWYDYLAVLKQVLGNTSNDMSAIACLAAKYYLCNALSMVSYDAAAKPQGASGLDIDERTAEGLRVIGEVKTTTPFLPNDFGAAQAKSLRADFTKLNRTQADYKFLFVSDSRAYGLLRRKYAREIPDVQVVLLNTPLSP